MLFKSLDMRIQWELLKQHVLLMFSSWTQLEGIFYILATHLHWCCWRLMLTDILKDILIDKLMETKVCVVEVCVV